MISKTEEKIINEQKIIKYLLSDCLKSKSFIDLHGDYLMPLNQELLNDFEVIVLSTELITILKGFEPIDASKPIPLLSLLPRLLFPNNVMYAIEDMLEKSNIEKNTSSIYYKSVYTLIQYVSILTMRFMLRFTGLIGGDSIVDSIFSNIDTWLLGDLELRSTFLLSDVQTVEEIHAMFDNGIHTLHSEKENSEFKYKNILAIADEVQNFINFSIGNDDFSISKYPESEKIEEILSAMIADFVSVIFFKARHHNRNMNICNYCNTIHFGAITVNDKKYTSNTYCNECYIEKNLKEDLTNMYWNIKGEYKHMIVSVKDPSTIVVTRRSK